MSKRKTSRKTKPSTTDISIEIPKKMLKSSLLNPKQLTETFFNTPSYELAINLLGKLLVRKTDSILCKGRIVETECYPGGDDKASITFKGRRTPATEPLYMPAGTLFVYMTYGMYHCMNISSSEMGGGVLIRALEPIEGIDYMRKCRIDKTKSKKEITTENLCNGPSKLCTSMQITKQDFNTLNMVSNESIWIEDDPKFSVEEIVKTSRIGINSVEKEWREKPYRFYLLGNVFVSKRDLSKEKDMS